MKWIPMLTGVIAVICAAMVLLGQSPQPQLDKLPAPGTGTPNFGSVVPQPAGATPKVPAGFSVSLYADQLPGARYITVAPNGDLFVSQYAQSIVAVLRDANKDGVPEMRSVYASAAGNLPRGGGAGGGGQRGARGAAPASTAAAAVPCTMGTVPPGTVGIRNPQGMAFHNGYLYIANTDSVVRYKYTNGDMTAQGQPEKLVDLITGGHTWRNVIFNTAGTKMYVSVGSASNVGDGMGKLSETELQAWQSTHPLGAAWGNETDRAAVLAFDPEGKNGRIFATGIRNCVGMAVAPGSGDLWCSTNERDGLGDDVPTDYVTRVREGAFYGWPWYYIGANEDPRRRGERPDLKDKITIPDVLIQAHSASLQMTFYQGAQFPAEYRGNIFAAEHGSWNRSRPTGYKVIRVIVKDGVPTGEYEDFATGFVIDDRELWGRPVGVAVANDGALLVSEDADGTIWRITYSGKAAQSH